MSERAARYRTRRTSIPRHKDVERRNRRRNLQWYSPTARLDSPSTPHRACGMRICLPLPRRRGGPRDSSRIRARVIRPSFEANLAACRETQASDPSRGRKHVFASVGEFGHPLTQRTTIRIRRSPGRESRRIIEEDRMPSPARRRPLLESLDQPATVHGTRRARRATLRFGGVGEARIAAQVAEHHPRLRHGCEGSSRRPRDDRIRSWARGNA